MTTALKKGDTLQGRVKKWTLGKSAVKQTKFVRVTFMGGHTWTGYITDTTEQHTMNALETMGFNGSNLKMMAKDDALDTKTEFELVVEKHRVYQGKVYYGISFVNKIGGFQSVDKSILDDFDIDTRSYMDNTKDEEPEPDTYQTTESNFTADDIPF